MDSPHRRLPWPWAVALGVLPLAVWLLALAGVSIASVPETPASPPSGSPTAPRSRRRPLPPDL